MSLLEFPCTTNDRGEGETQGGVTGKQVQHSEVRRLQIITRTTQAPRAVFPTKADTGSLSRDAEGRDVGGRSLKRISSWCAIFRIHEARTSDARTWFVSLKVQGCFLFLVLLKLVVAFFFFLLLYFEREERERERERERGRERERERQRQRQRQRDRDRETETERERESPNQAPRSLCRA